MGTELEKLTLPGLLEKYLGHPGAGYRMEIFYELYRRADVLQHAEKLEAKRCPEIEVGEPIYAVMGLRVDADNVIAGCGACSHNALTLCSHPDLVSRLYIPAGIVGFPDFCLLPQVVRGGGDE